MAILIEHFGGKFPFWLSPRQIMVVPVAVPYYAYAQRVKDLFWQAGFYCDADLSEFTLNKKIRNAELAQYNFICVVGGEEQEREAVNVRSRDDVGSKTKGETRSLEEVLAKFKALNETKSLVSKI